MHVQNHKRVPRGKVLVLVAVTMPALFGATAIALDGGVLQAQRRRAQAVADAAAMAGAIDLFHNYPTDQGSDGHGGAEASALAVAAANGFKNDEIDSIVTVNIPPESGNFEGEPGYIEVITQWNQRRGFSGIWGSDRLPVRARAVARGAWLRPRGGVVVLHPTSPASFSVGGQSSNYLNVSGGEVIVNSSAANGINVSGGNSRISASGYFMHGSPGTNTENPLMGPDGTTQSDNLNPNSSRLPDPFRYLPEPTVSPAQTADLIRKMQGNTVTSEWNLIAKPRIDALVAAGKLTSAEASNFTNFYLLSPGVYDNLPNFTGNSTLVLLEQQPSGGIFQLNRGITVNGAYFMMDPQSSGGIMLYNTGAGNSQGISLGGNSGKVWLEPPTSGTYENMVIFQSRNPANNIPPISISGGAQFDIAGSIYSANGELSLSGSATGNKVGSQQVTSKLTLSGGANITVTYDSGLQAYQRHLRLVE